MQKDAKCQVMPPKFNYKTTSKSTTPNKFSCFPTVEEEGTEEILEESDNEDKNYEEETVSEKTPAIYSITEKKKNSFAIWQPFIPSNWQENSYQNLPAQPCWKFSLAPPCSSLDPTPTLGPPPATIWSPATPQIHPDQKTTQWQENQSPTRTWKQYREATDCCNYNWNKHWPKSSKMS